MSEFFNACKNSDFVTLNLLMSRGIKDEINLDLHTKGLHKSSLMQACYSGNYNVVKYLINNNLADINQCNAFGKDALMFTFIGYEKKIFIYEITELLLKNGAKPNKLSRINKPAFIYLLEMYNINENICNKCFDLMMQYGLNISNNISILNEYSLVDTKKNLLMHLCEISNFTSLYIIENLLKNTNLQYVNKDGETVVLLLLRNICIYDAHYDTSYKTPFSQRSIYKYFEYFKLVVKYLKPTDIYTLVKKKYSLIHKIKLPNIKQYFASIYLIIDYKKILLVKILQCCMREYIYKPE